MPTLILVLIALSTALVPAATQAQAAQTPPTPGTLFVTPQDAGWRVHQGDDPAYASASFDDSAWQQTTFGSDLPASLLGGSSRWFRKRIALSTEPVSVDLLLIGTSGSFDLFLDGRRVDPYAVSSLRWEKRQAITVPLRTLDTLGRSSVEVAIHSHLYTSEFSDSLNFRSASIGSPASIATIAQAYRGERLGTLVFPLAMLVTLVLASVLVLSLFRHQPAHKEYLWLGLSLLFFGFTIGLIVTDIEGGLPYSFNAFLGDPCTYFFIAAQLQFVFSFISLKPGRLVRLYQIVLVVLPLPFNALLWLGFFPNSTLEWVENTLTLPAMILVLIILVRARRLGNREAGLLILPTIFANAAGFLFGVELIIQTYHRDFQIPSLHLGLVEFTFDSLFSVPYLVSVAMLIFARFNQVSRQQTEAQADLEAARIIQQILIPEALPHIPGFQIESVYHPAQQVGGDFFQILPLHPGGVLVVLGDVSGKGLAAAMNVSLIVGTLRTLAESTDDPAEILTRINARLLGRSTGFTTALALRILPDGVATLVSAGHLNPYLNGHELLLESSLPLGLAADATYGNTLVTLSPHDSLTLLTDGVLEARNPKTQELFGFARTLAISSEPAHAIAAAAQAFGQEDDIAILTLTFANA